jgi:hypothetical protein
MTVLPTPQLVARRPHRLPARCCARRARARRPRRREASRCSTRVARPVAAHRSHRRTHGSLRLHHVRSPSPRSARGRDHPSARETSNIASSSVASSGASAARVRAPTSRSTFRKPLAIGLVIAVDAEHDIAPVFDLFRGRRRERGVRLARTRRHQLRVAEQAGEPHVIDRVARPHRAHRAERREVEHDGRKLTNLDTFEQAHLVVPPNVPPISAPSTRSIPSTAGLGMTHDSSTQCGRHRGGPPRWPRWTPRQAQRPFGG